MVKGSIKLVIQSDAKQAEKDLQALEKSAQRIKDLEKENGALGKSYDQMRAKAEKAAQATLEAASKAAAVDKQAEAYASSVRDKYDFGLPPKEVDYLAGQELSGDEKYQKLAQAAQEAADKHHQLSAAQKEAEKSAESLKQQIAENTQQLAAERAALTEHQEKTQKSAASTQKLNEKLKQTAKSGKKASAGLLGVGKSAKSASRGTLNLGLALKSMLLYMGVSKAIEAMKAGFADLAQASSSFNGTMSGLSSSFLQVRNSIAAACAPALQALTPVIQTVANAFVTAMNAVGAFSARLFGNATTFTKAKYAAVDYAKSVADTAKTVKDADKEMSSLASFDQVNNIQKSETGAATAANNGKPAPQDMFETVGISEETIGLADRVREAFEKMIEPWKTAWASYKPGILTSMQSTLGNIASLAQGIGSTIASWWASEHGQSFANTTLEMFQKIASAADRITQAILNIWNNGGSEVFYNLMTLGGNIVEIIEIIIGYIAETYADLVEWFAPDAETALSGVNDKISQANSFLEWLKTDGKPILEVLGTTIGVVTAAWLGYKAVMLAVNVATKAWDLICKGIQKTNWIMLAISAVVAIIIVCIRHWDEIKAVAIECWDWIKKTWEGAGDWFHTNVTEPITNFFSNAWNGIKTFAAESWNKIKETWNKAKDWFRENITEPVTGFFTTMWAYAKRAFNMGIDWIKKKFTDAVNGGITLVESFINFIIRGLNVLVRGINKLSFDVPDWVPGIGGKSLGFSIPLIPQVQIPRLATGAVIPPNREFAAILGDQRHGTNIEAPESLIRQIVREELGNVYNPVLNAINNSNLGKKATIMGDVYMDSQKVGRVVAKPVFREGNRAGYLKVKV